MIESRVSSRLWRLFSWRGRATRLEFWLWVLVTYALGFGYYWFMYQIGLFYVLPILYIADWWALFGNLLVLLVMVFTLLGVMARRLHDLDQTGLWILLPIVILAAGVFVLYLSSPEDVLARRIGWGALFYAVPIVKIMLAIPLACFRGTQGENRYGFARADRERLFLPGRA